jgi:hypothetical protein
LSLCSGAAPSITAGRGQRVSSRSCAGSTTARSSCHRGAIRLWRRSCPARPAGVGDSGRRVVGRRGRHRILPWVDQCPARRRSPHLRGTWMGCGGRAPAVARCAGADAARVKATVRIDPNAPFRLLGRRGAGSQQPGSLPRSPAERAPWSSRSRMSLLRTAAMWCERWLTTASRLGAGALRARSSAVCASTRAGS